MWKMFPFDDVIMLIVYLYSDLMKQSTHSHKANQQFSFQYFLKVSL